MALLGVKRILISRHWNGVHETSSSSDVIKSGAVPTCKQTTDDASDSLLHSLFTVSQRVIKTEFIIFTNTRYCKIHRGTLRRRRCSYWDWKAVRTVCKKVTWAWTGQVDALEGRHARGSRKRIPGSDPKDLDPGSVRIIDPTLTVCRQIHWGHRSAFAITQEVHSDPRSETPYCVGIHRDPISDKRNSRIFCALFKRLTTFFIEI